MEKVEIVSGFRDIGKQGTVIKVDRGKNELTVSQCNMVITPKLNVSENQNI
jgi:ribosomal protein L24